MNRLMKDIREGIATNTLDEVEAKYVHPDLMVTMPTEMEDLSKDRVA